MRVAFRVDASKAIGTGHLKRCLSLADALRSCAAEVRFIWRDHGLDCEPMITAAGFHSLRLPSPPPGWTPSESDPAHSCWAGLSPESDAMDSAAILSSWTPDWIVVDHYGLDARWHDAMRASTGSRIAAIDDLGDRALVPDILIDHNPSDDHAAKYRSCVHGKPRILGGPSFALLGERYKHLKPAGVAPRVSSIGIFMGGVDAGNHSALALKACREAGFAGRVEIASTSANPNLADLRAAIEEDGQASLLLDAPELADFFSRHDVQIGAGGGASWERCRAGVPSIVLATADNQSVVIEQLNRHRSAIGLNDSSRKPLVDAISLLISDASSRKKLAAACARLVDGRGCERIAFAMAADSLSVRPAGMDDAEMVHRWRNAPSTRAVSLDSGEIPLADHLAWFARSLANTARRRIFIGEVGGLPVGVVRFDRKSDSRWEVSIFLDPELPGLGLGRPLLLAGEAALSAVVGRPLELSATTIDENRASQALFRSAGYDGERDFEKSLAQD